MKKLNICYACLLCMMLSACDKAFLEKKYNKSLLVPTTLEDFQALLDNTSVMNIDPALGNISGDEFVITASVLKTLPTAPERNSYIWRDDMYEGSSVSDWNTPYQQIFYTNVVLDGLKKITDPHNLAYDNAMGSAFFYRAHSLYNLAQLFMKPYLVQTADTDPGIPIRLNSDVNEPSERGTVKQVYNQIIQDINEAEKLLPLKASLKTRPSKWACWGLLARIYLAMNDYPNALKYADECLEAGHELLDYNTLIKTAPNPFPEVMPNGNAEVIHYRSPVGYNYINNAAVSINHELYDSYNDNDLRKILYFNNRGNGIIGRKNPYCGLAVDEIYLIRAECNARLSKKDEALSDLNTLMINRWVKDEFVPFTAQTAAQAMELILKERRKSLILRGTRWTDLRRLNLDDDLATTLKRDLDGEIFILLPNSPKYVLPIPDNEINTSGIAQNIR